MARSEFGSVLTLKNGYRGRYRVRGREYYTPAQRTKRAVREELATIRADILENKWVPPKQRRTVKGQTLPKGPPTLREFAAVWLAERAEALSPNTVRSYTSHLDAHILPVLGDERMVDITAEMLQAFADQLDLVSVVTRKNVVRTLSSVLTGAREEGRIIEVPKMPRVSSMRKVERRGVALSAAHLRDLVDAVPAKFRALFALAGWCSLRYGEVAALQRKHIDTEAWTVTVERAVKRAPGGSAVIGPPKSRASERVVSIPPPAQEAVRVHLEKWAEKGPAGLVFPNPGGWGGLFSDKVLRRVLDEATGSLKLPSMRFHDLRHTGLTLYGLAGATLADLMARAGHTSAETVMVYQHSSVVRDRELSARMGG